MNRLYNSKVVHVSPVDQSWKDQNFPKFGQDHGYILTQLAVDDLLNRTNVSVVPKHFKEQCKYLLITNSDNIYHYDFYDEVFKEINRGMDLVGFEFTSHHFQTKPWFAAKSKNVQCFSEFAEFKIDLGAGVAKLDLINKIEDHFVNLDWKGNQYVFTADGIYYAKLANKTDKKIIIHQVLMMHQ